MGGETTSRRTERTPGIRHYQFSLVDVIRMARFVGKNHFEITHRNKRIDSKSIQNSIESSTKSIPNDRIFNYRIHIWKVIRLLTQQIG